ncbi:glycoside hydrolase [Immersiella caudata]|uniref:alpha-1,2-Mannosidase n=1 Tax=Immersiella caudata TaxID=314043 RepID=A0AA40BZF1_9PEZI|nr:glycoside hydrolase [Immersiella caudata]
MLSLTRRRNSLYLLAGLIFTFVFLSYRNLPRDALLRPGTKQPPSPPGSRWSLHKPHHPIPPSSLHRLPTTPPLSLPRIQKHPFPPESPTELGNRLIRQQRVKDTFLRCWSSYRSHAWLSDELRPVSGGKRNPFGGWGATLVDSLDTLWIMGLRAEFNEAVEALGNISFDSTRLREVSVFETNIRYLGGFLAAYDLSGDERLLAKAKEVGEMLYAAFDTPNRMPVTRWDLNGAARGRRQMAGEHVLLAELGTFGLEFTRLSMVTGEMKWFDAAQRITGALRRVQNETQLPGMWPVVVDARGMKFGAHGDHTLGAMADSWFEYLPKMYALVGGLLPEYKEMYEVAMSTAIRHNLFRPMVPGDADILMAGLVHAKTSDGQTRTSLRPEGQHLVCFAGGLLALGGRLIEKQLHVDKGEKITDGCVWAYKAMPLGIMPETFYVVPCESILECKWDEKKWVQAVMELGSSGEDKLSFEKAKQLIDYKRLPKGFTAIPDTRYHLRPEAIESVFVLYRITGRKDLMESAWDMFQAIDSHTRTELANSALMDVTVTDEAVTLSDTMESFWLGETLKYFYLMFSEPDLISLDEYVFNTEAHPLQRLLP